MPMTARTCPSPRDMCARLEPALSYLESRLCEKIDLREAARRCGFSRSHFMRLFQKALGLPAAEYVRRRRLSLAAEAVVGGRRVLEAALEFGYSSHSTFTRAFSRTFGIPPAVYARSVRAGDAPTARFTPVVPLQLGQDAAAPPERLEAIPAL
jgi:AraC-like DNA-binding protein